MIDHLSCRLLGRFLTTDLAQSTHKRPDLVLMDRLPFFRERNLSDTIFRNPFPAGLFSFRPSQILPNLVNYYTRPAVLVRRLAPWWVNLDRNLASDSGERVFLNGEFCGPLLIFLALNREWCLSVPPQFPFDPTLASRQLRGTQVRGTRVCRSLVQFNGIRGRYQ